MYQNNNKTQTLIVKQPIDNFTGSESLFFKNVLIANNFEPNWFYLSLNNNSGKYLMNHLNKVDWIEVAQNPSFIEFIEKDYLDNEGNLKLDKDGLIDFSSSLEYNKEPDKVHVMTEFILKNENACHLIRKIIEQRKKLPKLTKRDDKEDNYYPEDEVQIMEDMPNFWCRIADNKSKEAIEILKENWKEFDLSDEKIIRLIKDEQQYTIVQKAEKEKKYLNDCRELEEKKEKIRKREAEKEEAKKNDPNIVFNDEDDDYDIEDLDEEIDIDDYEIPIVISDEEIMEFVKEYRETVDDHWDLKIRECKKYRVHKLYEKIDDDVHGYLDDYILRERNVWENLSSNPFAFDLLINNRHKICFDNLSRNPRAMEIINTLKKLYPQDIEFIESRFIINEGDIIQLEEEEYQNIANKINFEMFSLKQPFEHIKKIMDEDEEKGLTPRISYKMLLGNNSAFEWIKNNLEKVIEKLPQSIDNNNNTQKCENWCYLSINDNPDALEYLSNNINLIDKELIWSNKGLFTFNKNAIDNDEYVKLFKQDLENKTKLNPEKINKSYHEFYIINGIKHRYDYLEEKYIAENDDDEF